ncbi:MAG TPA: hypothetical protein VI547_16105, partial [Anaerolineales bacterium]|nr:hypothetical protein [Anaerolineales bacterium]
PPPTRTPPPTSTPDPFPDPVLKVAGEEEIVFDWTTDRCEREQIPDLAVRAFRDRAGQVQLITSHYVNYRMTGPDLNQLTPDCRPVMRSDRNADPAMFNDHEWLASLYTEDGQTIYALVHVEYQGHTHLGQCPSNDYFSCWYNTITLAVSEDGGVSYHDAAPPPSHLVATLPIVYLPDEGPYGVRSPSNIIKGQDGYYYAFLQIIYHKTHDQWVCLMRTQDLADPKSWRYWNGEAFEGQFANPYTERISNRFDYVCEDIDWDNIGASMVESITYNTAMNRYVLVGLSADHLDGREVWGVFYSFSQDLIHWTRRKLLLELSLPWTVRNPGSDVSHLYPSLLDPDSLSRNFETTDTTAYLYFTRNNFGQGGLDRDLIRVPVEFFPSQADADAAGP